LLLCSRPAILTGVCGARPVCVVCRRKFRPSVTMSIECLRQFGFVRSSSSVVLVAVHGPMNARVDWMVHIQCYYGTQHRKCHALHSLLECWALCTSYLPPSITSVELDLERDLDIHPGIFQGNYIQHSLGKEASLALSIRQASPRPQNKRARPCLTGHARESAPASLGDDGLLRKSTGYPPNRKCNPRQTLSPSPNWRHRELSSS
jgi:hypothetical protein